MRFRRRRGLDTFDVPAPRPGLAFDPTVDEPTIGPSTPSGVSSAWHPTDVAEAAAHHAVAALEAHRPQPAANAWPDDAVLLTYGELRRLIALHLTLCASTMPHDQPWVWMRDRARAVSEGEAPLLISEVLSPPALPPG